VIAIGEPLARIEFDAQIISWRGPAPFLFAPIPEHHVGEVSYAARQASYGWGVVPVKAKIGRTAFTTSLFPRDGGYLLPIKLAVQRAELLGLGDNIHVSIMVVGA
jgi:Domain of unknown function (DUF1905)